MEFFREFSKSLETTKYECISTIPTTYKCYDNSLQNIIRPIYAKLTKLEDKVREQGKTISVFYNINKYNK